MHERCAQFADKMRFIIIVLVGFQLNTYGQKWTGKYQDYFGHSIEFYRDSTFKYEYRFDLLHTWAVGKWKVNKDTIHLNFEDLRVYDTLIRDNRPDSLIESRDEKSNRLTAEEFAMMQMSSGGQSSEGISDKLLLTGKRLYQINNKGKRVKGRRRGIWPQKRWWGYKTWPVYYMKEQ